jgi:hypothetical protein
LAPAGILGIDDNNAILFDKDGSVAAANLKT